MPIVPSRRYQRWVVGLAAFGVVVGGVAWFLRDREHEIAKRCDNIYVALNGTLAGESELPTGVHSAAQALALVLERHTDETNPRNRAQRAFTSAAVTPAAACQVQLEAFRADGMRFSQFPRKDRPLRTFSIRLF